MRLFQAIEDFAFHLRANGKSPRTIEGYHRDLDLLQVFLGDIPVKTLTPDRMARFVASDEVCLKISGERKAEVTINRTKAALKSFGRWLEQTGVVDRDPSRALEIRRASRKSPSAFTEPERKRFLRELTSRKGTVAQRDRVMAALMLGTGIRLSELVGLDIADVDLETKHLTIHAKGGRTETRFLNSDLRRWLRKYLRIRADMDTHSTALFLSNRNTRISTRQVQTRFKLWLTWAGINRPGLSVHSLRHTFGTRLYRKTKDLVLVGRAMGHRTIEATRIYVHPDAEFLEDAIESL